MTTRPPYPVPDAPLSVVVTATEGYTNVQLKLCGPLGPVATGSPEVTVGAPNTWTWALEGLVEGRYQAAFLADPDETLYGLATFEVWVRPGDRDGDGWLPADTEEPDCDDEDPLVHPGAEEACGDGVDSDCDGLDPPCMACDPPAGNLLDHTTFEEGMDGLAPVGWEVRDPGAPGRCPGSPESHVFIAEGPPDCGGHALVIDAGGTWDCYAIQTVSGYSTIQPGKTYVVGALVRSEGNSVNPAAWFVLGVQWLDASDTFFGDEKNPRTQSAQENDYDWKLLSFEVTAPPEARRILVWLTAHYPGRVSYDNVFVIPKD